MRGDAPIEWTAETIAVLVYATVFWIVVVWWIGRNNRRYPNRQRSIPLGLIPIAYLLLQINPLVEYLLYRMNLRRSQRIRAFLQLADDIRMRKNAIDGFFPRGSGR